MTFGSDDQQIPSTPALTRRELRERERASDAIQPVPGPSAVLSVGQASVQSTDQPTGQALESSDGIHALFGAPTGGSTFVPAAPTETASPFVFGPTASTTRQTPAAPASFARVVSGSIATQSTSVRPKRIARTIGSRLLSLGALVFAAALAFGMTVPANAFYSPSTALAAEDAEVAPKALQSVDLAANVEGATATRDKWSVLSWAEVLKERYGTRDYNYTVGMGPIRWPFPFAVPISSGFGERIAPCKGCSSHHMGVDFTPGTGAPIFVIADGVVTTSQDDQWGFGNHVIITHQLNGHTVTTLYAHMQHGSTLLKVGDVVKVGDLIGAVGQTGTATGAHLHLEVTVDGTNVDPFAWLKANAS